MLYLFTRECDGNHTDSVAAVDKICRYWYMRVLFVSSWRPIGKGWGIRMSGVNNGKFVIDFRLSRVRQALSCVY